jgi:hypothetical protein
VGCRLWFLAAIQKFPARDRVFAGPCAPFFRPPHINDHTIDHTTASVAITVCANPLARETKHRAQVEGLTNFTMAGGLMQNARLGVKSSHRKALLRNLVTSLVKHEAIETTYPKAKAAQRVAEKLITLAKRNNETSRRKAMGVLFVRHSDFKPALSCKDALPT